MRPQGYNSVGGVVLPGAVVSANAGLVALLNAAAQASANVCVDVTVSSTSGLITSVGLDATVRVWGDATLDADSATLGGIDVPLTLLDAEAEAALSVAIASGADVCVSVVADNTALVQANLTADIDR